MTMAAANLEIREALAAHEVRRGQSQTGRDAALWELESRLEELRLEGYERVPSTFPLAAFMARAHLTEAEAQYMRHTKISMLISFIFEHLLLQPVEDGARDSVRELKQALLARLGPSSEAPKPATPDVGDRMRVRRRRAWGAWAVQRQNDELAGFHRHAVTGMLCDVRHGKA